MKWILTILIAGLCGLAALLFLYPIKSTVPFPTESMRPTQAAVYQRSAQETAAPQYSLDEKNTLPFSRRTAGILFEKGLTLAQVEWLAENPPLFPIENILVLLDAGLPFEEIQEMMAVYKRWFENDAHAYVGLRARISNYDAYQMARYASVITGGGIDPLLIVAILRLEVARGKEIGKCNYFLDERKPNPNLRSRHGEADAFAKVVAGINSTRHPRYRMKKSYPEVSCDYNGGYGGAMGIFQILPSMYLAYEWEAKHAMGAAEFVSPYHFIPAFLAAAAILRDIARQHKLAPELVTIGEEDIFKKIAATYNAGRNWRFHIGDERYGGRVHGIAVKLERENEEPEGT